MICIYKIPADKKGEIKKVLEAPDHMEEDKLIINEFARSGYEFRDGSGLGFNEEGAYVYIDATDEFFKNNEKKIMLDGVIKLEGEEFEKAKKAFEDQADNAAAGVGAIFGDF